MSKIDALIQELQFKKKKLDYLEYIKDLLSGDQKCIDFVEVQEEVLSKLIPLINNLSSEIEDGVSQANDPKNSVLMFTETETRVLKAAAAKVMEKANNPQVVVTETTPKAPSKKNEKLPSQDKMNFAMENRHLGSKKVRVLAKDSNEVMTTGVVVGLDAPNVIVKTVEGPTIEVPLNKILLGETA